MIMIYELPLDKLMAYSVSMIKINRRLSQMNCNRTTGEPVEKEALDN